MRRVSAVWLLMAVVLAGGLAGLCAEEDLDWKYTLRQGLAADEVVKKLGEPAAKYRDGDEEYWLYEEVREKNGERRCPEMMFRKGKFMQVNWLLDTIMKKTVEIAKSFGDWQPPTEVVEKTFLMKDTGVVGKTKEEVLAKLGQPDVKKVFNGKEIWVYRKVKMAADKPETISIYLTLEEGKVTESAGN